MSRFTTSDRHHMFYDVDRWNPLVSFSRYCIAHGSIKERIVPDTLRNFKVESLFDYSLLNTSQDRKKIVQLSGIAPIIEGLLFSLLKQHFVGFDLTAFNSRSL